MNVLGPVFVVLLFGATTAEEKLGELQENVQNSTTPSAVTIEDGNFGVFNEFVNGLSHLYSALDNPNSSWTTASNIPQSAENISTPIPGEVQSEAVPQNRSIGIENLFSLVVRIKALSDDFRKSYTDKMENTTSTATENHPSQVPSSTLTPSASPRPDFNPFIAAVNDLSQTYDQYINASHDRILASPTAAPVTAQDGLQSAISALEDLLAAHQKYHNASINNPNASVAPVLNSEDNITGLLKIIEELGQLAAFPDPHLTSRATTVALPSTTTVTTDAPTSPATCEPPLQEIAYRMCILVVKDKRLNWYDAGAYCRARGGQLAQDSVVIKTRRYLNELYGEEGLRVRWPFWVGGHEVTEEGAWRWQWKDGGLVSSFLWSHKQPRYYSSNVTPRGSCMILDGFQAFYGGSLPCHLRRRFVCQMWK